MSASYLITKTGHLRQTVRRNGRTSFRLLGAVISVEPSYRSWEPILRIQYETEGRTTRTMQPPTRNVTIDVGSPFERGQLHA